MKIWNSYGAEHSLNLVILGKFKDVTHAEEFKTMLDSLTNFLRKESSFDIDAERAQEAAHCGEEAA